jgi:hypothetical protein
MPRYQVAEPSVLAMLHDVASSLYPDLARIRFEVLMARSDSTLPAIEVRPTTPLHRSAGLADALVVICAASWEGANEATRRAMLDHALASVAPVFKDGGLLATDSAGRPRLVRRRPDLAGIGYRHVWERNREVAIEAARAGELKERAGQLLMFD